MIWDSFTYNGETDLLNIRMAELSEMDATHIAVEGSVTFTNKPKPYFHQERERFAHFWVDDMPDGNNPWEREKFQRNKILELLKFMCAGDDDLVIISDADEVPNIQAVRAYRPEMGIAALVQNKYGYWLNCEEGHQSWARAKIMTYAILKQSTPDVIRNAGQDTLIHNGGWHWSYLGGVDAIMKKLDSFSHQEVNTPTLNNREVLEHKLATGQSLWSNKDDDLWRFVPIDASFPRYVQEHQHDSLKHLIKPL